MRKEIVMEKFVPYEKLSKKERKKRDSEKRIGWNINPVTRKPDNPKAYKRKKTHFRDFYPDSASFFFIPDILQAL